MIPGERSASGIRATILLVACLVLFGAILYAGLEPFRAPANDVTWDSRENLVHLGRHGTIISSGNFRASDFAVAGRTLEIWLQPGLKRASHTLLAFYDPTAPAGFSLHQSWSDLELRIERPAAWHLSKRSRLYVDDAFLNGEWAFWAIASGPSGTVVYRNGTRVQGSLDFRTQDREFSGRLVLGNSPIYNDSWPGAFRGLALFSRELTQTQILRHYGSWQKSFRPEIADGDDCIALYLFKERAGGIVHNEAKPDNDLIIPKKYLILAPTVLDPIWNAFRWTWGFWKDAILNFAAFVPFGWLWCAYFSTRRLPRPRLASALLAVAASLLIELIQSNLPTRDSSMADLCTNSLGGILGVGLYSRSLARATASWSRVQRSM